MSEKTWTWNKKKDYKKAVELEEYIKDYTINKVIGVVSEYMKTAEKIIPSILIEKIKEVMENDND